LCWRMCFFGKPASTFPAHALAGALALAISTAAALAADAPQYGTPVTQDDIAAWDISVGPDGAGLPPGKGTVARGEMVYAQKCQACHNEMGKGGPNDRLVGGFGSLAAGSTPIKTIGSYWPYATTLFDYVRRAMPWNQPKSLTDEEVYAVTAYLLNLNGIIGRDDVIDAQWLPKVKMPNRDGFIPFPRDPKN
jgi:S-disulfanyl-L-cysteine oxidoreductase SoxD